MPNKLKGETHFRIGEETYRLLFDYEALCLIEDATDQAIEQVLLSVQRNSLRLRTLRVFLWAGLQRHHPDVTREEAAGLILQSGIAAAQIHVAQAFAAAFPEPGEKDASPQETATDEDGASPTTSEPGQA